MHFLCSILLPLEISQLGELLLILVDDVETESYVIKDR